jgi:hypothetical protein
VRAALQKAHNAAQEEVKEAQDHLRYLSEYHSSATISSSLLFHEELLDIKTLTAHLALMQEQIHKLPALETLAQVVLRALGEEKPEQIEQAIETMAPSATLRSQGNQQVRYHRLLALATALLLRGAAGISATPANDKEWLKVRAGRLGSEHRELEAFIHAWEGKMSGKQLDPKQTTTDIALFTMVLTIWVQSWWEQDALFKDLFTPDDVLSRLAERNVNTVKTTLNLRTAFTANPADMGQRIEAFLLAFPAASEQGNHFLSQIVEHYLCVPFPDKNVLSTLWMMHYVTLSDYLDEQGHSLSPPQSFFGRLFSSGSPLLGMPTASSSPSASPNGATRPSSAQNTGAGQQNDALIALSGTGDQQDGASSLLNGTP